MTQHVKAWLAPLALALLVGVTLTAAAAEAQSPTLITSTTLYASVKANGTLASGNGVVSILTAGTGNYVVVFNRNVRDCAYEGTIGSSATSGAVNTGEITVVGAAIDVNGVFVTTDDSNGVSAGRPFMLSVYCS
jgi:hypothetical protein